MKLKGIFIFVLIFSNEIFISSNKNHYFKQFDEVINGISISSYFRYLTNNMLTIFLFRYTVESLIVSCSIIYGKLLS